MNKNRIIRVLGGCAAIAAVGAAMFAASVSARGLDGAPFHAVAPAEAQVQVAQLSGPIIRPPAPAAPTERKVSFTDAQATSGQRTYMNECVECHGEDLNGGLLGGPPLRGVAFSEKFLNGATASGLYLFTQALMPPNKPGALSPASYAELVSFILKRNGFQAGAAELPSDPAALDYVLLEK